MKQNKSSSDQNQKSPEATPLSKAGESRQAESVDAPLPHEAAEARLFGGIERETQMHPGSSLFTTEH
jgi:hypothetical protein